MSTVPTEWLADALLRGMLLALLLLLAWRQWRDRPASPNQRLAIALPLGLAVQVGISTPLIDSQWPLHWLAPGIAISLGDSVLFWLFVRALVEDAFAVRWRHFAIWAVVVAFVWLRLRFFIGTGWAIEPHLMRIQSGIPPLFAALSALAASRHWRDDLVERRRWLRMFVVVTGIGYVFLTMLTRAPALHGRLARFDATLDVAFLLLIIGVIAQRILRLESWAPFATVAAPVPAGAITALVEQLPAPPDPPPVPTPLPPPDPAEQRLAEALQHAMLVERAYRTEELTVASLATRLAVPEYRLRKLINQRLGHRNFNAFVNGFRIQEACAALADPARRELPILTIALEAGFQSIGPFNRAFKAATGLTPGDFRREKLADS